MKPHQIVLVLLMLLMCAGAIANALKELRPSAHHEPAQLCFNSEDNFKTDYCAKMGKQWSI